MKTKLFPKLELTFEEEIRVQWYAVWAAGVPKKGNPHNWFLHHAKEHGDFLSNSYVLHVHKELTELEARGCSLFDIDSLAFKRTANKDGFNDVKEYLEYLNNIHVILVNQKIAQSCMNYEYQEVHDIALLEQLKSIRTIAYEKGYDVALGALAFTMPFATDRGELIENRGGNKGEELLYYPTEEELKVAKQFWNRANDDLPFNALDRSYNKRFPFVITPTIANIKDYLFN